MADQLTNIACLKIEELMHQICGEMTLLPRWHHQVSTDLWCKWMCGNRRAFS